MDRTNEEKRKESENYYKENIMPLLIKRFKELDAPGCEHLILTLGTSYEAIVFSILGLKPKKILILCTAETREKLDDVVYFTNIRPSQYKVEEVDSENILILYEKIKDYYEKQGRPKNIFVDFTGGTKAMSAGCAMAASLIGAKAVYIASNYSGELRKPIPGSERLCFIKNPYEVFGDIKRREAINLFNKMDYKTAYHMFSELDYTVLGTKEHEPLKYLSSAYNQWDSLNISCALENLTECKRLTENEFNINKGYILVNHLSKIEKQIEHLKIINDMSLESGDINKNLLFENISYLIFSLYQNALRREAQGKYEMASLLLYRILEMISQSRFWEKGIDTEKITEEQYNALGISPVDLLQRINDIKKKIKEKQMNSLPEKISLINGYIILGVSGDELIKPKRKGDLSDIIKELRGKVSSRNLSIFAHGFQFQQRDCYDKFKETVREYIDRFCQIHCIGIENMIEEAGFIIL